VRQIVRVAAQRWEEASGDIDRLVISDPVAGAEGAEGAAGNGLSLPFSCPKQSFISPVTRHFETTPNSDFFFQRREIHRDIDNLRGKCSFQITRNRGYVPERFLHVRRMFADCFLNVR
jgi:hypothetical protein